MPVIYTCPKCRRRYTIYHDGDYLCECGMVFFHPPVLSTERACFVPVEPLAHLRQPRRGPAPIRKESLARRALGMLAGLLP